MSRTFEITLGGTVYAVPRFNLGQLREIAQIRGESDAERAEVPFTILAMALKRATPSVVDEAALLEIEPEDGEFAEAMRLVMENAGLRAKAAPEGEAKPPETGAA